MKTETIVNNQSPATARETYTTGVVPSKDGTTIGYRQLGHGPGVVVVHGAMESAQSHMQLAEALADMLTVYLPDRRGRGLSGPYGNAYSIQKDVEDLDALLTHTGAHQVFGVSSGAIIALQAALTIPAIHKVALFEPPLSIADSTLTSFMARYDREIAQGKVAAALVTGMKATQMGPPILNLMPNWLLESLTNMLMKSEDKKASGADVTMRMLAPTLGHDFRLIGEAKGALQSVAALQATTLLLGGSASPAYLKASVDALAQVLPHAKRIEFPGLNHGASGPTDRGGQPERVAQELRRFFA